MTKTIKKIIYAGTPDFAVAPLQALVDAGYDVVAVYTQPDRPSGRGQKLAASPVKQLATQLAIPVYQPITLKAAEQQKILADFNADIMIVAAYGLILPQAVLDMPKFGCVNIHASWLPRWRGAAPIQQAILAGDSETGITIMQMAAGLDTGEMICLEGCAITDDDTAQTLHDKLAKLGAEAILDGLKLLVSDDLTLTPQQEHLASYADKLTKAEAKLNWQKSALDLHRAVRAYNPWPVAFSEINNKTLRIWQASPMAAAVQAEPGTIVGVSQQSIDVACGEGVLALEKIQWPGKNIISAADVINNQNSELAVGKQFG